MKKTACLAWPKCECTANARQKKNKKIAKNRSCRDFRFSSNPGREKCLLLFIPESFYRTSSDNQLHYRTNHFH